VGVPNVEEPGEEVEEEPGGEGLIRERLEEVREGPLESSVISI
jgi:hypothetical protein